MGSHAEVEKGKGQAMLVDFAGGFCGGIAMVLVGQPMDTVKVKMQTCPEYSKNMVKCFKDTVKLEGVVRGLYAGTIPAMAAAVSEMSVMMATYGLGQKLVARLVNNPDSKKLSTLENSIAGSFSGIFTSLAMCPMEHIKCRMQTINHQTQSLNISTLGRITLGPTENELGAISKAKVIHAEATNRPRMTGLQAVKIILVEDGFFQLFRALTPTMLREVPGCFFFFSGIEGTKMAIARAKNLEKDELGSAANLLAGGIGGVTFWAAIFPADMIKSRMQVLSQSEGFLQVTLQYYRDFGLRGFYSGLAPCLIRSFPSTAVFYLVYEFCTRRLENALQPRQ